MLAEFTVRLDPFTLTLIFIFLSALVAAFVRGRQKDKCLKDLGGDIVHVQRTDGKLIWGRLVVENTGMELQFAEPYTGPDGITKTSYIVYKSDFPEVHAVVRFLDLLDENAARRRCGSLDRTWHPGFFRRLRRRTVNVFRTIRDSFVEVVNVMVARAQSRQRFGQVLTTQDRYVQQMKSELVSTMNTAFEPLLERHIGHCVVVDLLKDDRTVEYVGVLKDYTAEFVEVMNVQYSVDPDQPPRPADLVVPRLHAHVRHAGE